MTDTRTPMERKRDRLAEEYVEDLWDEGDILLFAFRNGWDACAKEHEPLVEALKQIQKATWPDADLHPTWGWVEKTAREALAKFKGGGGE